MIVSRELSDDIIDQLMLLFVADEMIDHPIHSSIDATDTTIRTTRRRRREESLIHLTSGWLLMNSHQVNLLTSSPSIHPYLPSLPPSIYSFTYQTIQIIIIIIIIISCCCCCCCSITIYLVTTDSIRMKCYLHMMR